MLLYMKMVRADCETLVEKNSENNKGGGKIISEE